MKSISARNIITTTFVVVAIVACKLRQDTGSLVRDDDVPASSPDVTALGDSDIGILIPIAAAPDVDPFFGFGNGSTGVCNLPRFSDGKDGDPILTTDLFQQFSKDVFRVVTPLPPLDAAGVWKSQPTQQDLNANDPTTLADSTECEVPRVSARMNTGNDDAMLATHTHVAVAQRVQREACDYNNWRVVAVRFEPCPQLPRFYKDGAQTPSDTAIGGYSAEKCGKPVLRVTAQAFSTLAKDQITDRDMAMHLFFELDDINPVLTDLRTLARVTKQKIAASADRINALDADHKPNWQNLSPNILTPHPGLALEQNCGDATTGPVGDVAKALWDVLKNNANASKLKKITWQTSNDNSNNHWTMGTRIISSGRVVSDTTFLNENFSSNAFGVKKYPFSPFGDDLNNIGPFYPVAGAGAASTKANLQMLYDIVNPLKTNFFLGGKNGASCISCHLHDQTEYNVGQVVGKGTEDQFKTWANGKGVTDMYPEPALWSVYADTRATRNQTMINLRNFGYSAGVLPSISRRAANEVDLARQFIATYLSGGASTDTGTGTGTGTATDMTAWQVFSTRCSQCHGATGGRAPHFKQAEIDNYTDGCKKEIVYRTSLGEDQDDHMPFGAGMLSAPELAAVRKWAGVGASDTGTAPDASQCRTPLTPVAAPTE